MVLAIFNGKVTLLLSVILIIILLPLYFGALLLPQFFVTEP